MADGTFFSAGWFRTLHLNPHVQRKLGAQPLTKVGGWGRARWRVTIFLLRWKVPFDKAAKEGQLEKSSVNSADTLQGVPSIGSRRSCRCMGSWDDGVTSGLADDRADDGADLGSNDEQGSEIAEIRFSMVIGRLCSLQGKRGNGTM